MSIVVGETVSIQDVSDELQVSQRLNLGDLRDLVIPAPIGASVSAAFNSVVATDGSRLIVSVNDEDVIELRYSGDSGTRSEKADLSRVLRMGVNDFRIRCILAKDHAGDLGDNAEVWLGSDAGTVIRKRFTTSNSLEPFDLRWTLLVQP